MDPILMTKMIKDYNKLVKSEVIKEFKKHEPEVAEIIMASYSINLTGAVNTRKSRTNPGLSRYVDTFRNSLYEFGMTREGDTGVDFKVPDEETIPFDSGPMQVIQTMLEGTAGLYVEIDAEQYEQMYGKPPRNLEVFDDSARKKDMIYIIRYTADVRRRERETFGENILELYPFSNTPPIDIFDEADEYVEMNIDDWLDSAIGRATEIFNTYYGR